jgi:ribosome-associated protein
MALHSGAVRSGLLDRAARRRSVARGLFRFSASAPCVRLHPTGTKERLIHLTPSQERLPGPRVRAGAPHPGIDGGDDAVQNAANLVLRSLEDDKAEDILAIDIRGRSSFADMMIVASGRSQRHVGALADHVMQRLKEAGATEVRAEGLPHCDWVLVDAGDVIVHIFRPEVRSFYNLEKIWSPDSVAARA